MNSRTSIHGKSRLSVSLLSILVATSAALLAQHDARPAPAEDKPILERTEGTDSTSKIHYVRLMLSRRTNEDAHQTVPPRFTVECQDVEGKHEMLWFLSFGGIADPGFVPPFHPNKVNPHPPHYPTVNLKMVFEGYIKSKPFTRSWNLMPSGEFRYRNGGLHSPNMESAQWFQQFLRSLPGFRVAYAKPQNGDPGEIFFPTQPLLDKLNETPACSP